MRELDFLYIVTAVCLIFAIWQGIQLFIFQNKLEETNAQVINTSYANPNGTSFRNSKWATVSYNIDGQLYVSAKKIQVPMQTVSGSVVKVKYFRDNPSKLALFSKKKFMVSLCVTLIFFLVTIWYRSQTL